MTTLEWIKTQAFLRKGETHEQRFKRVVRLLVDNGIHPGPTMLTSVLPNHNGRSNNINGRETRWRREELLALGYKRNPATGRWKGAT